MRADSWHSLSTIAVFAIAFECPRAAAALGALAYWLIAHSA
jgi:hypothetical protein